MCANTIKNAGTKKFLKVQGLTQTWYMLNVMMVKIKLMVFLFCRNVD